MSETQLPTYVDVAWTANLIGRSPSTVYYWIHTQTELGPLFARIGKRRIARRVDIEQWLDAQFVAAR